MEHVNNDCFQPLHSSRPADFCTLGLAVREFFMSRTLVFTSRDSRTQLCARFYARLMHEGQCLCQRPRGPRHSIGLEFRVPSFQMLMVQSVVADINRRTGESECQYYKDRLLYTEDGQRDELIGLSKTLSCHGELKNNRGLVSRCPRPLSSVAIATSV